MSLSCSNCSFFDKMPSFEYIYKAVFLKIDGSVPSYEFIDTIDKSLIDYRLSVLKKEGFLEVIGGNVNSVEFVILKRGSQWDDVPEVV